MTPHQPRDPVVSILAILTMAAVALLVAAAVAFIIMEAP